MRGLFFSGKQAPIILLASAKPTGEIKGASLS
jgi:hypothetical protein